MSARRGEIWWASLGDPQGSGPGFRRPVLVVSADEFNASLIGTVVAAVVTTNIRVAEAPGNVRLPSRAGLPKPSVVNVSQLLTVDKRFLSDRVARLSDRTMDAVESGLRLVLALR
jgi:mRNA interferase MazF